MWKQINYGKVYTQRMSKQCQAMINFSLKNSTVILPIQNLQSCWESGMLPVAWLPFTNPGNPSLTLYTLRSPETLPGFLLSSLHGLSESFAETENNEGEQNLLLQNMSLWHKDYFRLIISETADTRKTLKTKDKLPFCKRHLICKKISIFKGVTLSIPERKE